MSIIDSFLRARRYDERLVQIRKQAKPAEDTGATSCQRSGYCCWKRPCDLYPGDVERLAAFLGLSVEETFKRYLIVDEWDDKLHLLPRRGQQVGGRYLTSLETFDIDTPCVFLDTSEGADNACKVHAAKPTGGAHWHCAMSAAERDALPEPEWTVEALMALGWDGEKW